MKKPIPFPLKKTGLFVDLETGELRSSLYPALPNARAETVMGPHFAGGRTWALIYGRNKASPRPRIGSVKVVVAK